ncbi:Protein kinase of the Mitotic Exit Network [Marasmius tenuissimus]|nr:Protein kinase of the Mitotic Exit Network [Marasmius tenuissimus]
MCVLTDLVLNNDDDDGLTISRSRTSPNSRPYLHDLRELVIDNSQSPHSRAASISFSRMRIVMSDFYVCLARSTRKNRYNSLLLFTATTKPLLAHQQLGDLVGKGAFGQVYHALNWATREIVAVKKIQLSGFPTGDLRDIISEFDVLKHLNHPNIVKYKGFVKTGDFLCTILEFCENGSLYGVLKRFGKFPENLVAGYVSQILKGLVYLHDQGVIHRDIKGANIFTNKDGTVKLADFGVASSTTMGFAGSDAIVWSPYWTAPEVIKQSGATTASDIWSVGCVVIKLLTGAPPYNDLDTRPARSRIVQDDYPPNPKLHRRSLRIFSCNVSKKIPIFVSRPRSFFGFCG